MQTSSRASTQECGTTAILVVVEVCGRLKFFSGWFWHECGKGCRVGNGQSLVVKFSHSLDVRPLLAIPKPACDVRRRLFAPLHLHLLTSGTGPFKIWISSCSWENKGNCLTLSLHDWLFTHCCLEDLTDLTLANEDGDSILYLMVLVLT